MAQKTVIISNDQSLYDIAIQELGNAQAVLELALVNNISSTARLIPGQVLIIPESLQVKREVLAALAKQGEYQQGGYKVSTATKPYQIPEETSGGIGSMIIGSTFRVY